jgi:hypothetical protein
MPLHAWDVCQFQARIPTTISENYDMHHQIHVYLFGKFIAVSCKGVVSNRQDGGQQCTISIIQ